MAKWAQDDPPKKKNNDLKICLKSVSFIDKMVFPVKYFYLSTNFKTTLLIF